MFNKIVEAINEFNDEKKQAEQEKLDIEKERLLNMSDRELEIEMLLMMHKILNRLDEIKVNQRIYS